MWEKLCIISRGKFQLFSKGILDPESLFPLLKKLTQKQLFWEWLYWKTSYYFYSNFSKIDIAKEFCEFIGNAIFQNISQRLLPLIS